MPTTTSEVLGFLTTESAAHGESRDPFAGFHVSVRSPDSLFSCMARMPLRSFDEEVPRESVRQTTSRRHLLFVPQNRTQP